MVLGKFEVFFVSFSSRNLATQRLARLSSATLLPSTDMRFIKRNKPRGRASHQLIDVIGAGSVWSAKVKNLMRHANQSASLRRRRRLFDLGTRKMKIEIALGSLATKSSFVVVAKFK